MEHNESPHNPREKIRPWHIYSILTILLAALAVFALVQLKYARDYKMAVENQYNRSFHELVEYVNDVDMALAKGQLVSSPRQLSLLSNDIWREASAAQASLGQLPTSQFELSKTEVFLSQVGDYCYMLSKKAASQEELTQDEYDQMKELGNYASALAANLKQIQSDLYAGTIRFSELEKVSAESAQASAEGSFGAQIESIEKEFQDYPSLIYDGPFSSHLENMEAIFLRDLPDVSEEDAEREAIKFLAMENVQDLTPEEGNTGILETYSFSVPGKDKNENIMIDVTKKGGEILWMTNSRPVDMSSEIPMEEALSKAKEFLTKNGYPDMKNSYYQKTGGSAVVNFAYYHNDAIYYPDLVKVKVALDNGEITGFEARGFVMRHNKDRQLNPIKLTQQEAQAKLNKNLTIENCQLAVIPLANMDEVLCYEFKGKSGERDFIIYVNTETGEEEDILILLETPDGILTM